MQLLMQLLIIVTVLIVVTIGYVGLDFYGKTRPRKMSITRNLQDMLEIPVLVGVTLIL